MYRNGTPGPRRASGHNDRLAIALLGARDRNIDWYRQGALRRHVYKLETQERDKEIAEKRRLEAET